MSMVKTVAAILCAAVLLAGCATPSTVDGSQDNNDPFEGLNRALFAGTLLTDKAIVRPVAIVYRSVLPQPVRDSVRNTLNNLDSPVILTNDVLQGELDRAGVTFMRAIINTTFGVAGLFDVAQDWGYQRHSEDFGQTLAVYGIGEGPYIFLPIIGPANPRDLLGFGVDIFLDPLTYVQWGDDEKFIPYARFGLDTIDLRARNIETLDEIERMSVDYYASVRSLYRQARNNEIKNGEAAVEDLPDF